MSKGCQNFWQRAPGSEFKGQLFLRPLNMISHLLSKEFTTTTFHQNTRAKFTSVKGLDVPFFVAALLFAVYALPRINHWLKSLPLAKTTSDFGKMRTVQVMGSKKMIASKTPTSNRWLSASLSSLTLKFSEVVFKGAWLRWHDILKSQLYIQPSTLYKTPTRRVFSPGLGSSPSFSISTGPFPSFCSVFTIIMILWLILGNLFVLSCKIFLFCSKFSLDDCTSSPCLISSSFAHAFTSGSKRSWSFASKQLTALIRPVGSASLCGASPEIEPMIFCFASLSRSGHTLTRADTRSFFSSLHRLFLNQQKEVERPTHSIDLSLQRLRTSGQPKLLLSKAAFEAHFLHIPRLKESMNKRTCQYDHNHWHTFKPRHMTTNALPHRIFWINIISP